MRALLPLADIGQLIGVVIFVLFLVISVAGQLATKWREIQQEAQRRAGPRRPPPTQGPLEKEIAEFLRTAGQRRRPGQVPSAAAPNARPPEVPARAPIEQPLEAEIIEPEAGHLREALQTRRLVSVTPKEVSQADQRLQEHLHGAFNHHLGPLAAGEARAEPAATGSTATQEPAMTIPPAALAGFGALLASGESVRQAIILSEILTRPEHRWHRERTKDWG